jgi:hypothetical protein
MNRIFFSLSLTFIICLTSCSSNEKKSDSMLPAASGRAGEMIVVIDSSQWKSVLGREIKETFGAEVPGLPREERMFKMNQVDPERMNQLLRQVRNLLFVVTLDNRSADSRLIQSYFTQESLEKIRQDDDLFVFTAENEFAKGQQVMYLFGRTEDALIEHIRENRESLQDFFNNAERARLTENIFRGKKMEGLSDVLKQQHECTMTFPVGYELVVSDPGFAWFRQMNPDNDKNIFISYAPYTSESMFSEENLIQFRDSVAKNQLFGDPAKPETFVVTETEVPFIPVLTETVTFNGQYAVQMKGLWRTNTKSMGGPFISYALVDENLGRFYYIEGFVYSPGVNQREYIREMDVVLHTFEATSTPPADAATSETPPAAEE